MEDSELVKRLKAVSVAHAAVGDSELQELADEAVARIRALEQELVDMAVTMKYLRPPKSKV